MTGVLAPPDCAGGDGAVRLWSAVAASGSADSVSADSAGAVVGFEALLTDFLRVLGPDHPDTLRTRNNLAHWEELLNQRQSNRYQPDFKWQPSGTRHDPFRPER